MANPTIPRRIRFGDFEADLVAGELRKEGSPEKILLQDQPLQILRALVAQPGEMVSREELIQLLWNGNTNVDFDPSLNKAINRLRESLGDSAEAPRYIETLSRRGYRFLVPVERVNGISTEGYPANAEPREWKTKHRLWITGAFTAALLLVAAFVAWRFYPSSKAALNFNARDWVFISTFENRTGEPVLDGTLEYALEREVSNSQFVNVVPRERIDDVLRLMRKPLDTKIDAPLGREICLRDGGIRVLLTGRVEKLGTTYVLSVQLMDPVRGVNVASLTEEGSTENQLASAVRRLSNQVRETLGEKRALVRQSEQRLEKVTTPSLHALQLYTQANELMRIEDNQTTAGELLERAVVEDPGFASAHLLLGWTYHNRGKEAQARPEFQRALDLADTTTDRERFFIIGSYYHTVGKDPQKAIEAYETLLRLYPDHYWGNGNLFSLSDQLLGDEEYGRLMLRQADLRPSDPGFNAGAAWEKAIREQDPEGARPYLQRASALVAAEGENAFPQLATWVNLFPAYEFWLKGNVTQAHAELVQTERTSKALDPGRLGVFYLAFGELREAERHFPNATDANDRKVLPAIVEWMRGVWYPTKKRSQQVRDDPALGSWESFLMVRTDLRNFFEQEVRKHPPNEDPSAAITMGQLALARGDIAAGISLLEQGLKATRARPPAAFFFGSESLAQAYRKQDKLEEALRILLQASGEKARTYDPSTQAMTGAIWMRTELQLADLYREMGRVPEAEKVESELRKMLIYADADYPILRELQKRNPEAAAVSSK